MAIRPPNIPPARRVDEWSDERCAEHVRQYRAADPDTERGCWLWTGRITERVVGERVIIWPLLGVPTRQTEQLRRFVFSRTWPRIDLTGYRVRIDPDRVPACDPTCFNPDHMLVDLRAGYELK